MKFTFFAITALFIAMPSYGAEPVKHSHNGRTHSHVLPVDTGSKHTHNQGAKPTTTQAVTKPSTPKNSMTEFDQMKLVVMLDSRMSAKKEKALGKYIIKRKNKTPNPYAETLSYIKLDCEETASKIGDQFIEKMDGNSLRKLKISLSSSCFNRVKEYFVNEAPSIKSE